MMLLMREQSKETVPFSVLLMNRLLLASQFLTSIRVLAFFQHPTRPIIKIPIFISLIFITPSTSTSSRANILPTSTALLPLQLGPSILEPDLNRPSIQFQVPCKGIAFLRGGASIEVELDHQELGLFGRQPAASLEGLDHRNLVVVKRMLVEVMMLRVVMVVAVPSWVVVLLERMW